MPKLTIQACPYYAMLLGCVVSAGAQEKSRFEPQPPSAYASRQTFDKVTITVEPYESGDKVKQAFGKVDFSKLGVLPVLVLIANDSDQVLQLERMRVQLITVDHQTVDPIPAEDVQRSGRVKPPDLGRSPGPIPGRGRNRNKKVAWEIEAREFTAPVIPAGGKAHGFFYFRVGKGPDRIPGSKLYITGIRDARTGKDLLYFEISLDEYVKNRTKSSRGVVFERPGEKPGAACGDIARGRGPGFSGASWCLAGPA